MEKPRAVALYYEWNINNTYFCLENKKTAVFSAVKVRLGKKKYLISNEVQLSG